MRAVLIVLALIASEAALAQTAVPCTSSYGCPRRSYFESQPCSSGTCNRTTPPSATEFQLRGMSLAGLPAFTVEVCAASGQTLTGTGKIRVWLWSPWEPNATATSSELDLNIATNWISTACYGTLPDAGLGAINCQCRYFYPVLETGGLSSRRVMAQAVNVATSGGSAVTVKLIGLEPEP